MSELSGEEKRKRCAALTRSGKPCKNPALPGAAYCHVHLVLAESEERPGGPAVAGAGDGQGEASKAELRQEMARELDELIEGVRASTRFRPPPFSPQALVDLLKEDVEKLPPHVRADVLARLREAVRDGDIDTAVWESVWYMLHYWRELQQQLAYGLFGGPGLQALAEQIRKAGSLFNEDLFDVDTWKGLWFMLSYSVKY